MNVTKLFFCLAIISFIACTTEVISEYEPSVVVGNNNGNSNNDFSSSSVSASANTQSNAILVTVGNTSSHTISSNGEHWFKFVGTGDPVIFETTGDVVDTYMTVVTGSIHLYLNTPCDDNSGEGSNALCSFTTTSGETYWIKVTARSSTSGTYTFVVKSPTSNLRANPIMVSVGNSSSHTIFSNGTHWFIFTGTGERVFFETEGNVVNTNMGIYIGDNISSSYSNGNNKGINFITVSGTTYYIKITGNSGTYTFNVRNGTGDGSSRYNAIEVTNGYSSSHTITSSGETWFIYSGTGNMVTFKTIGNVVDTYITVNVEGSYWSSDYSDDNSGDGNNALCSFTTKSETNYWIKVTARSSTNGTYTFVVE